MSARSTLAVAGQFRKPGFGDNPQTGQTLSKKLTARQKDFDQMSSSTQKGNFDKRPTGYHKPGSLKK